jgi:hypothetical protein
MVSRNRADCPLASRAAYFTENEMRKKWTPTERADIMLTIERKQRGGNQSHSSDRPNAAQAAKMAGFSSERTARDALRVARSGNPDLIRDVDEIRSVQARPRAVNQRAVSAGCRRDIVEISARNRCRIGRALTAWKNPAGYLWRRLRAAKIVQDLHYFWITAVICSDAGAASIRSAVA